MEALMNHVNVSDPDTWGSTPDEVKGEIALFFGNARISKKRYNKKNDRKKILEEWEQLHDYKNRRDAFIEIYPS